MLESFKDKLYNHFNKIELVKAINESDDLFEQAMNIALENKNALSWRAPWILSQVMKQNDARFIPYLEALIKAVDDKEDGYQRELLKIIGKMNIPEELEGTLFDKCTSIWEQPDKKPGTRIVAFKLMLDIVKKYPELKSEVTFLTQNHYTDTLSPGIMKTMQKMLRQLEAI